MHIRHTTGFDPAGPDLSPKNWTDLS